LKEIAEQSRAFERNTKHKALGDMLQETRTMLQDFYMPYNRQLAYMIKDPKFLWLK
jgi:hypothetical protein